MDNIAPVGFRLSSIFRRLNLPRVLSRIEPLQPAESFFSKKLRFLVTVAKNATDVPINKFMTIK